MRRIPRSFLLVLLATWIASPSLGASHTGAPSLDDPFGIRGTAMGQVGVADRSDPDNIYFNPANVTAQDGIYATGAYELLAPQVVDDWWFRHVSVGAGRSFRGERPVRVAFSVSFVELSQGYTIWTTPTGAPLEEGDFRDKYVALTGGMATTLGERVEWALGAAYKHWNQTGPSDPSAGMFDIGTVVSTSVDASDWSVRPAVGLSAVNLGPDIEYDREAYRDKEPLPSWFNYGLGVCVEGPVVALGSADVPAVSATFDFDGKHGLNEQHPQWGVGYELSLVQIASVRWGRRFDDHDRYHRDTWGVALGVPLGSIRARIDYTSIGYGYGSYYSYSPGTQDVFGVSLAWLYEER
jgi:hypothetical protein